MDQESTSEGAEKFMPRPQPTLWQKLWWNPHAVQAGVQAPPASFHQAKAVQMSAEALDNIEKLHRLKSEGIITEEEFDQAKQKYLFGPALTNPSITANLRPAASIDEHLTWMTLPLKRYADFHGRSTRREFWMFQLIPAGVIVGAILLSSLGMVILVIAVLALLGLLVPQLAVQTRRFHDQGRSGWLVLINLVPYVGSFIVLVFMLMEGTKGANEYGPDPLS